MIYNIIMKYKLLSVIVCFIIINGTKDLIETQRRIVNATEFIYLDLYTYQNSSKVFQFKLCLHLRDIFV